MEGEASAQELHQRRAQGIALTDAEQARLDAWYAQEDAAEATLLLQHRTEATPGLQTQLAEAMDRLRDVTRRIDELSAQNASLRGEIAALEEKLAQRTTSQVA